MPASDTYLENAVKYAATAEPRCIANTKRLCQLELMLKRFQYLLKLSRCSIKSSKTALFDFDQGNLKAKPPHLSQGILLEGLLELISHLSSIIRHLLHLYSNLVMCTVTSSEKVMNLP